jgi:plastocyanin
VKVGEKIHWTNNDPYPHNVTAKNGAFKSGNLDGGKTFDFTAKKAGRIPYVCTIHSGQKGAIVVSPA